MTETELIDRLREAIVLDGPDVWRTNGYLQDAQQAGLSLTEALKRANEVGQEVTNNSILFQNIQTRIARLAQPSRAHLIDQDLNQIVNAATSLKLSPDFVKNRWVPTVLHRLAATSAPSKPEPSIVETSPDAAVSDKMTNEYERLIEKEATPPPAEIVEDKPVAREPVVTPVELPKPAPPPPVATIAVDTPPPAPVIPLKPPIVRAFTATPARVKKGQPVTLEWDVENVLAVTIDDLGEGLSPKNRGWVKPAKDTDYTLFDANNNPLSTVRVGVIKPDRSGIYGVLFALALLAIIYWFIRSGNAHDNAPEPRRKTEQRSERKSTSLNRQPSNEPQPEPTSEATDTQPATAPEPTTVPETPKETETPVRTRPADESVADNEPETKPENPAQARSGKYVEAFGDKPYDKVELGADEQGWRRARSKGRWGFIDANDDWVIQPEFEAVTPFHGNTASVFLNGQLMTINRSGEQVRN